jgi:membrane protease YdiL (CAAX protease family)
LDSSAAAILTLLLEAVVFCSVGLAVFGRLAWKMFTQGGKVITAGFGPGDFGFVTVLASWFILATIKGFHSDPKPVTAEDILDGSTIFGLIVVALCVFMQMRGINVAAQFGITPSRPGRLFGIAAGLMLVAFPIIIFASEITVYILGSDAKAQEPVLYFAEAAEKHQYGKLAALAAMAVIVAPVCEEFIFRGYIYGVLKRYCGLVGALIFNAALFAAVHVNLASLPALYLLAVCFTIAYETTGSILVCMGMHALFNLTSLLVTFHEATTHSLP